jgi:hypothetical protein
VAASSLGGLAAAWAGWQQRGRAACKETIPARTRPRTRPRPRLPPRRCPADENGNIILGPAPGPSAPATLTCDYALLVTSPEPGVLTALISIGEELPPPRTAAGPAPVRAAAEAAASPPRRFSFRGGSVARRGAGECALLRGAFEAGPAAAPAGKGLTTGSLLAPNSTSGALPPTKAPGVRLCRAETAVKFTARFGGGGGGHACNLYRVRRTHARARARVSVGTGGEAGGPGW